MQTTAERVIQRDDHTTGPHGIKAAIIPLSVLANALLFIFCLSVSVSLLGWEARPFGIGPLSFEAGFLQDIFGFIGGLTNVEAPQSLIGLGRPVQDFLGLLLLLPTVLAAFGSVRLLQGHASGRYATLALQFVALVLCTIGLLHLWGIFLSFERIVDGIMQNPGLILLVPLAYGINWASGRMDPEGVWRGRLELISGGVIIIGVILIILYADVLGATTIVDVSGNLMVWAFIGGIVLFGWLGYQLLGMGYRFHETPEQRDAWQGWLMLAPNIIGFTLFFAGPLLLSFYLSFTNSTVGNVPEWVGFDNYADILSLQFEFVDEGELAGSVLDFGYNELSRVSIGDNTLIIGAKDDLFWRSLFNTILFCLMLIPLATIPALGMALILNSKLPGVQFFRAVYFLPSVAAVVGTALIWRWLYDPTIGYINYGLTQLVEFFNSVLGANIAPPDPNWLTNPSMVLFSMVIVAGWGLVGFNTVLFLAGLQGIPKTLYEAATVDGAGRWAQFRHVTLPMLGPTTFFVVITTVIQGLQEFNLPFALFPSRPIPLNATTSVYYLYNRGFFRFEFGYASSVAWLLFALIFMITLVQFRAQRRSNAYQ